MPELPEVETVRQGLEHHVIRRTIAEVAVYHPRATRRHLAGDADFRARLAGAKATSAVRRGKYLWLPLDTGDALVAHLGMSGQFRLCEPSQPRGPHDRVSLSFADGGQVRFVDQRTFGGLAVEPLDGDVVPPSVRHIGLDLFDPQYDPRAAALAIRTRDTEIKRALLDQTLVSGIGNIYADEALWQARVHFARPTQRMATRQVGEVLDAAAEVMARALAAGGTSFDRLYVNVNGDSGYFERSLEVYGRAGEACSRCGSQIRRVAFTNRSSYFCPRCQRPPRRTLPAQLAPRPESVRSRRPVARVGRESTRSHTLDT